MIRTSHTWRRLALDIKQHNQTTLTHPHQPGPGMRWGIGVTTVGIGLGLAIDPALGFVAWGILMTPYLGRNPSDDAAFHVRTWRGKHGIQPDATIAELPEAIPTHLLPKKDDYDALLHAAKWGDLDEE